MKYSDKQHLGCRPYSRHAYCNNYYHMKYKHKLTRKGNFPAGVYAHHFTTSTDALVCAIVIFLVKSDCFDKTR